MTKVPITNDFKCNMPLLFS